MPVQLPARALALAAFLVGLAHAGETMTQAGQLEYLSLETDGDGGVQGRLFLSDGGQRLLFEITKDTTATVDGKPATLPGLFALAAFHKAGELEVKVTAPAGQNTALAIALVTKGKRCTGR
jgi:hypothetical protein